MPEIGDPAPYFQGTTQEGTSISLDDYKGKRLALYFYPRDNTPGCTKQACNLRDNYTILMENGVAILGVSDDPVEKHKKFAGKFDLPFPLLADTQKTTLNAYGVYGEKKLYGRTYFGTIRQTFLIDESGLIKHIIKKPKVGAHAEEILKAFAE
ncbi:MAG: thioredoxin-dependent thiol peroxidase [Bacteroidetes bacterium]|nr:MAG: thioredoxin-dependent thiol peroxidase [Bacteroidota bacterium]